MRDFGATPACDQASVVRSALLHFTQGLFEARDARGHLVVGHAQGRRQHHAARQALAHPQPATQSGLARVVGAQLTASWGQAVVIDNRPGGSGIPAADLVAHAKADGYTLFMGTIGTLTVNPSMLVDEPPVLPM